MENKTIKLNTAKNRKDYKIDYIEKMYEHKKKSVILSALDSDEAKVIFDEIFTNRHEDSTYEFLNIEEVDTTEYKTFLAEFYNTDDDGEINFKDFAVIKARDKNHAKQILSEFEEDEYTKIDFTEIKEITRYPFIARAYLDAY